MEFATTISEKDFIAAYRLVHRSVFLTVWFTCLSAVLVWEFFESALTFVAGPMNPLNDFFIIVNICLLGLVWLYLPYFRPRGRYRKDPAQRGEMAVLLSGEGVSEKSSLGSNLFFPWTACARWRESRRVIVLRVESGVYFIFPKACLSAGQQDELRSILAAHLPKK